MGTSGSGAGGGSGGGSGGFGSGSAGGVGSVTLRGGALVSADPGRDAAFTAINSVFSKLQDSYLSFLLTDKGVIKAYEAMFRLSFALLQDRSWNVIEREFGVDGGPDCLPRLATALTSDTGGNAVSPALQAPLKAAVLDFLLRAVGDNLEIRNRGTGEQVVATADAQAFGRTANLFLGSFLSENLRQEGKNLNRAARAYLNDFAMAQADNVVAAFQGKFHHKAWNDIPQVSHSHMLRVLGGDPQWTTARLRKKVKP